MMRILILQGLKVSISQSFNALRQYELDLVKAFPKKMTAVGFEPTPLRNGALSHRLRPLGQTVLLDFFSNQSVPVLGSFLKLPLVY